MQESLDNFRTRAKQNVVTLRSPRLPHQRDNKPTRDMLSTIDGLPQSESTSTLLHGSKHGAYQVRRSSQYGNVSLRESFEVAKKTKPSYKMHRQQSLKKLGQELGLRNSMLRLKNKLSSPESRIRQQYAPLSSRGQEISPLGCHQSLASITLQDDASIFFMTEPN